MQAVMETAFDILYLCTVCILGITMIRKARGNRMLFLFGIMAVTLGLGDAFHLIPRAYALCTDGLAAHTAALGIGKFITSITMTIFYLLLFRIWELRYNRHRPASHRHVSACLAPHGTLLLSAECMDKSECTA